MLKASTFFRRLNPMTVEAAQLYWRTKHADVVSKVAGVRRYVQCHPILGQEGVEAFPFDGYAEFYVDSLSSLRKMGEADEFKAMTSDESNFIDRSSITLVLSDEIVLARGPEREAGRVKYLSLWKKPAEVTPQDYRDSWVMQAAKPEFATSLVRRTVSFPRLAGYGRGNDPAYDAVVCDWVAADDEAWNPRLLVPSVAGELEGSVQVREVIVIA